KAMAEATDRIPDAPARRFRPYPQYKDSGVEWLGEIPGHWEVRRIAMAVQKITNGYVGPTRDIFVDDGVPYLQSLHIKTGRVVFGRKEYFVSESWSKSHGKSILREGDVLVVQTGDIGQCCVVPKAFDGANCHALMILRLKPGIGFGAFLALFLQSVYGQNALKWSQTGALHPHLECGHVREIPIALPPMMEQRSILREAQRSVASADALITKTRSTITLLKEYRIALISEAVTGKIDVRKQTT
ncbi:MAG: restriction endonuclease subunit S, partial [Candidatus Latescibacteria bacterium]|nr:restriction endonuclease subunit S [Candidatus Latescibacterota bacterium]